jgi:hypothetical protein
MRLVAIVVIPKLARDSLRRWRTIRDARMAWSAAWGLQRVSGGFYVVCLSPVYDQRIREATYMVVIGDSWGCLRDARSFSECACT